MNIKECLLIVLIPLAIIPVFICFIIFSLFPAEPLVLFGIGSVIILVAIIVALGITNFFSDTFLEIIHSTRKIAKGDINKKIMSESSVRDINLLTKSIEKMRLKLIKHGELEVRENTLKTMENVATQVAHDIVSPLSSIQLSLSYFKKINPDEEILKVNKDEFDGNLNVLELATQRLKSISEDLLEQRNLAKKGTERFSIHAILDELIGELTGRDDYQGIEFEKKYYSKAINIGGDKKKIQRVVNNIIKNGFEAMKGAGKITVSTIIKYESSDQDGSHDQKVVISIKDSGPGLVENKIKKILTTGFTEGKERGHGIGLQFARQVINEHNGSLDIHSQLGQGATFSIILPIHSAKDEEQTREISKESFIITIGENKPVIIIDDDLSVLEQWRLILNKKGVSSILCNSYEDFCSKSITSEVSHTVIIDYHFNNSEWNGLNIISKLLPKGFDNLYLCTAEYWKPSLKEKAKKLNVPVCPKPLPNILIREKNIENEKQAKDSQSKIRKLDCVLIDDEELVRSTWQSVAKIQGKVMASFSRPEEFYSQMNEFNKETEIYIDSNLSDGVKGEEVAKDLNEKGFTRIYLTTGMQKSDFHNMPWIKGVIGKKPPFLAS